MGGDVDDEELWRAAVGGNGRAFGFLFSRHRDRVFRHLLRFVDGGADAEDLTATVFLELWRTRDRVRIVDGSLVPWLIGLATNVARNSSRATRRYRRLLAKLPAPEAVADHADTVAERSGGQASAARLASAMRALPLIDQQLLALTALEGYGTSQAGEAVGLSPGAARTRLSRARQRLARSIEPTLATELD